MGQFSELNKNNRREREFSKAIVTTTMVHAIIRIIWNKQGADAH